MPAVLESCKSSQGRGGRASHQLPHPPPPPPDPPLRKATDFTWVGWCRGYINTAVHIKLFYRGLSLSSGNIGYENPEFVFGIAFQTCHIVFLGENILARVPVYIFSIGCFLAVFNNISQIGITAVIWRAGPL